MKKLVVILMTLSALSFQAQAMSDSAAFLYYLGWPSIYDDDSSEPNDWSEDSEWDDILSNKKVYSQKDVVKILKSYNKHVQNEDKKESGFLDQDL